MDWHTYEITPIDFGWQNLRTVRETIGTLSSEEASEGDGHDFGRLQRFLADWEEAKQVAQKMGWDGDFRQDPVVFWVPAELEFQHGFVFKQENDGTTYVISPVPMPWLDHLV